MPNLYSLNLLPHHLSHVNVSNAFGNGRYNYLYRQSSFESILLPLPLRNIFLICDFSFLFLDELPSSSPHVLPPTNGAGGSPPDTGGQTSNPATNAPAPIPPPVPASAPVPTAPSPPSPTLPPHISQPPVSSYCVIKTHLLTYTRKGVTFVVNVLFFR